MEDRGSGYCSSLAVLLSIRNMSLGFFPPLFPGLARSPVSSGSAPFPAAFFIPATASPPLPNGPSKLMPAGGGQGRGSRRDGAPPRMGPPALQGAGSTWHWDVGCSERSCKGNERKKPVSGSQCDWSGCSGRTDMICRVYLLYSYFFSILAFAICLFSILYDSTSSLSVFFCWSPHGWGCLCLCVPPIPALFPLTTPALCR